MHVNAAAGMGAVSILQIRETVITALYPAADLNGRFMRSRFQKQQESGHVQNAENESNIYGKKGEGMAEVSHIVCMGILILASAIDIKYRKIPVWILSGIIVAAFFYQSLWGGEDVVLIAGGAAVGAAFLLISRVTKEAVGYGDSLGILGLGIYLGLWGLVEILAGAFFMLALCGAFVLAVKRMSRKCALPFYPFLAAAYAIWVIGEIRI